MRQSAKVYFQSNGDTKNVQEKVQQGIEGSNNLMQ
jgi:hypothetical protein